MNFIWIAGRLGREPEKRFTPSGQQVITFPVATNIYRKGQEETVWWRVTVWGDRFDKMMTYLKKGSAVIVGGELNQKPDLYYDKEGKPQVSSLDITADVLKFNPFGGEKQDNQQSGQPAQFGAPTQGNADPFSGQQAADPFAPTGASFGQGNFNSPSMDDDVPF
ncbi:MAG: single-stranded DNA-binding protein [Chlamydiia bacterium]|nr:single-stranded DNA-binding protein [Chlamydiia bacterium]